MIACLLVPTLAAATTALPRAAADGEGQAPSAPMPPTLVPAPLPAFAASAASPVLPSPVVPSAVVPSAVVPPQALQASGTADAGDEIAAVEVASGVYLLRGASGEPEAANAGRVGNAGFIVGRTGVIAVDTGTSYRHGRALLAAIARVTDRPVRLAVVTHTRAEFLFGAAAFRERGIPLAMQTDAAALMTGRCEACLAALRRALGEDVMRGSSMWRPDRLVAGTERLDLIGRPVELLCYGHSSGPGDLAVRDTATGALFTGGLVDVNRIPDIGDSDLVGWRRALSELRRLAPRVVVPGHGPAAGAGAIDDVERYLAELESRVRGLLKDDVPLSEVTDAATLPGFESWDQYDLVHRRNAAIMYLRLEREQLLGRQPKS